MVNINVNTTKMYTQSIIKLYYTSTFKKMKQFSDILFTLIHGVRVVLTDVKHIFYITPVSYTHLDVYKRQVY